MAKSKSFFGLRKGSTKSLTFQVLNGQQITKDRVISVRNPQSRLQMIQRVAFATASLAGEQLYPLIKMSFEGLSDQKAKQKFVSENAKILSALALSNDAFAAFSPKGNSQLIPNNYMVSRGSLIIKDVLVPKAVASDDNLDFNALTSNLATFDIDDEVDSFGLWRAIFGMEPGDQITVPQVYIEGIAQSEGGVDGEGQDHVTDLVRYSSFGAPRLVLKTSGAITIGISGGTTAEDIHNCMLAVVDTTKSNSVLVENVVKTLDVDTSGDPIGVLYDNKSFGAIFGISTGELISIGVILSRQDSTLKWHYSTCNMVTIGEPLADDTAPESFPAYHGYKLSNAINTYMTGSRRVSENFMQTGTTSDIVPPDFQ